MDKVVKGPDLGIGKPDIITHIVKQIPNEFKYSSMQIAELMANRQVPK